jgi:hypothetical protein
MSLRTLLIGSSFVLAAGLILSAAPAARAHEAPDGFYVEGGGGFEYWNIDSVDAAIDGMLNELGHTDGSFWAETGYLTIGFVDGRGTRFADPIGRDARIEGHVRWAHGDSHESFDSPAAGFFEIQNPSSAFGVGMVPVTATYETDLETWEADLLYRTDVPFSDVLTLTPYVGLGYAFLEIQNDVQIEPFADSIALYDDVEAHYLGLVLGGDAELRPVDFLSFRAGVRGDLMAVSARLHADQRIGPGWNVENDRDQAFAPRVSGNLGVALHFGMFELGIDGNFRYHLWVPAAVHPTYYDDATSKVKGFDGWTSSAMAHLKIYLP